ncbi:hypothetical protein GJ744_002069 [Endocarpon pusillum]|uniref:FAD-binding FR-type domain-containing protein n=1 Tax=Endocarpon pusillum TaxID=364733 RepID=A0A8H7ABR2_9EURO|nr:hypothetical protein GJ744_002069 [Endocarpon pusillum]
MAGHVQYLRDEEVQDFLNDLDIDQDGFVTYLELESKLDQVHNEIAPKAEAYNLHHQDSDQQERHAFLRSVLGTDDDKIPWENFAEIVKTWKVPSLIQDREVEDEASQYMKSLALGRKLRARWEVHGPVWVFMTLVVSLQLAFGIWQLVKYLTGMQYRQAFGWGLVLAKTSAGALYPTLFFLVISMSRWLATFLRRFYLLSRFINWDLSRSFHIKMSICALCLATLHAIGHLTGTFLYGSRPAQQPKVAILLGQEAVPRPYRTYIASLPGWSGLTSLILFYIIAALSMPQVRKWSYELFQLGHLLMFPLLGLLCAHGTTQLVQFTMLGYWLSIPIILVLVERITRILLGFHRIPARVEVLDEDTVRVTITMPKHRLWNYVAGQYVLLQVPQISFFQWHPFTISTCTDREMQLHIKTDGDWVSKLKLLTKENGSELKWAGIDGPYGAPAQRFYDFDQSIIMGAGIGVTPFSGILHDLRVRSDEGWARRASSISSTSKRSLISSSSITAHPARWARTSDDQAQQSALDRIDPSSEKATTPPSKYRRIDFHWTVRDRNYLLWFSDLLNQISRPPQGQMHNPNLDIRIQTHVTQKRENISTHIFRLLLEKHRTESHPASPITGLLNPTNFGRPNLAYIMDRHYEDMLTLLKRRGGKGRKDNTAAAAADAGGGGDDEEFKVGVFFCGAPAIGHELADRCRLLTARGREDRSLIEYHFMAEVFV